MRKSPAPTAYQELADRLRRRILTGDLKPGDRLPIEPELSAQYGVSRSTVREALRVLSSEKFITTTRGVQGGSFIVHPDTEEIGGFLENCISLLSVTNHISVVELLEVRQMLEVPAAGFAALRRDDDSLKTLRDALIDPLTATEEEVHIANARFHHALMNAARNPLLAVVAGPIFAVVERRFRRGRDWLQVKADHELIFAAVASRDENAASQAAAEHLERLRSVNG